MVRNLLVRRRNCAFCRRKIDQIDHTDALILSKYLTVWSKIKPAKLNGSCAKHQRRLTKAIKRARTLGLLPYVTR
jgi:small subunit ribosomal protein S18